MLKLVRNDAYLLATVISLVMSSGCDLLNPDRQIKTRVLTFLVEDSAEVGRLLSVQKSRDADVERFWKEKHSKEEGIKRVEDMQRDPERYTPGRREFLIAMSQQPGISIQEKTYLRLLGYSGAKCTLYPMVTSTYIRVRVTSGPLRGREGWVCEADVFRTVVMP